MIRHHNVYLKHPSYSELVLTQELLADEETMAFNAKWGGTVAFPKELWQRFYNRYLTGDPDYHYFHVYSLEHEFLGEVSSHFDDEYKAPMLNIKIHAKFRGHSYGIDALTAFLSYLFNACECDRIVDDVARDNTAAVGLLEHVGFTRILIKEDSVLMELKRAAFEPFHIDISS